MSEPGAKIILNVSNMTCQHCKEAIIKNLSALPGVKAVGVDLDHKKVTVSVNDGIEPKTLIDSLASIDFQARLIEKTTASK